MSEPPTGSGCRPATRNVEELGNFRENTRSSGMREKDLRRPEDGPGASRVADVGWCVETPAHRSGAAVMGRRDMHEGLS